jgi:hypothetical protein
MTPFRSENGTLTSTAVSLLMSAALYAMNVSIPAVEIERTMTLRECRVEVELPMALSGKALPKKTWDRIRKKLWFF